MSEPLVIQSLKEKRAEILGRITAYQAQIAPMITLEEAARMHGPSARGIVEHHDRRVGAAVTSIIRADGPEVASLGFPSSGIEHRRPSLVHEDSISVFQSFPHMVDDRTQVEARTPNPVAECCTIQCDPLSGVDFGLPVKRRVVAKLGHNNLCDQRFGRQATRHDMFRGMGLSNCRRTTPASVFWRAGDKHTELSRHDIEPLGDILADLGHLATTAGAERGFGFDDPLDPRQMFRKVTAVSVDLATLASFLSLKRVPRLFLGGLQHSLRDFNVFKRQIELLWIEFLGLTAELLSLQFADNAF